MISVLTQERLLGAALGTVFMGVVVFEQRRMIHKSIAEDRPQIPRPALAKEPILGKKTRSECAHLWNKAVDQTFGPIIESLSSHGW